VAANLDHPNIVTIHEVSQIEGVYFIAMQFLEGRTLSQILKAVGPLPVSGVQAIIEQIASALDYAHARGLVHRDIKPSNVIIANDGRATLTDFGLVQAGEGTKLSTTGVVFGTPEYMSPEQAEGKVLDARSDIYSLGVVLYEMLAGKAPFVADTTPAVMYMHVHEPPPLEELPRDLPRGVVAVVEKALAKKREDRFASAGEMAAALKQAVSGAVVEEVKAPLSVVAPPSETLRPRAERVPAPPVEARRGPGGLSWPLLGLFGLAVVFLLVAVAVGAYLVIRPDDGEARVPAVFIHSPPSGSQVQVGQEVIVQATATDSKGVTQVELWVNGVLHHSDVNPNPQGQSPFISQQSWRAPAAGTYTLMVRAYNAGGAISQAAAITVNVTQAVVPGPGQPTATPTVTSTPAPGTPTATWTPVIVATDTPTPTPTVCTLDAAFVADVTVPDGTVFELGARIDKIWRIRNRGNCPWESGYTWVLVSGDQMGAPASQAVSATAAGGSVDIGVTMYAPSAPGTYTGYWQMKSPDGQVFGQRCSVKIVVPEPTATPTPTLPPMPTPTDTPTPEDLEIVFDTSNASGWFGGDDRDDFKPRNVGVGQSIMLSDRYLINTVAFKLRSGFDFHQNPTGSGHAVTLILNVRTENGAIIHTTSTKVSAKFTGGWVFFQPNFVFESNQRYILTCYVKNGESLEVSTAILGHTEDLLPNSVGYSGIIYSIGGDMEDWAVWSQHPWDYNIQIIGTYVTPTP
jgi:serine/threonine-protein kinase